MARPTKLNSRVIIKISENILTGATYRAAAVAAGIAYDTFNEWRKAALTAQKKTPSKRSEFEELLVEFSDAVDRANAELEIGLMKTIKTRGKRDWKALAWILQNRFPADYAERKQVEHDMIEWDAEKWKTERAMRMQQVEALEDN
jgi:hypothetical protein